MRRIPAELSKAGLISTTTGKVWACVLAKRAEEIFLLEIYRAVDAPKNFAIHDYPVQNSCRVSCNIESVMRKVLEKAQNAFEDNLAVFNLAEVIGEIKYS